MRLQIGRREGLEQFGTKLQHLRRTAEGETGRDGVAKATLPVPTWKERKDLTLALPDRFAESRRRLAVHLYLPRKEAHVVSGSLVEQSLDRLRMNRGEGDASRRPVPEKFLKEKPSDTPGVTGISESLLGREGIELQPVQ